MFTSSNDNNGYDTSKLQMSSAPPPVTAPDANANAGTGAGPGYGGYAESTGLNAGDDGKTANGAGPGAGSGAAYSDNTSGTAPLTTACPRRRIQRRRHGHEYEYDNWRGCRRRRGKGVRPARVQPLHQARWARGLHREGVGHPARDPRRLRPPARRLLQGRAHQHRLHHQRVPHHPRVVPGACCMRGTSSSSSASRAQDRQTLRRTARTLGRRTCKLVGVRVTDTVGNYFFFFFFFFFFFIPPTSQYH